MVVTYTVGMAYDAVTGEYKPVLGYYGPTEEVSAVLAGEGGEVTVSPLNTQEIAAFVNPAVQEAAVAAASKAQAELEGAVAPVGETVGVKDVGSFQTVSEKVPAQNEAVEAPEAPPKLPAWTVPLGLGLGAFAVVGLALARRRRK